MTAKYDKPGVAMMIIGAVLPIVAAFLVCFFMYRTNVIMWIILMLLGVLVGLLLFMFVLNNRAEKVAYSQLEGRQGATGSVLQSSLRGTWRTSDMPVAFNPRTQDVVFRAVGKPGIVLFTEADNAASKKLLADERRKVQRVVPTVTVTHILVGQGGVPLGKLKREVKRLPKKLRRDEILAVEARLQSLSRNELPIPKGMDPAKIRPSRSQLR
jgi:hypothetical protein